MLRLSCLQEALRRAYGERDDGRGIYATFTWLVEEVGEVAEAILSGRREAVEEEVADLIAWTISIANMAGVDVEKAIEKKYGNILRDMGCSQKPGRPGAEPPPTSS